MNVPEIKLRRDSKLFIDRKGCTNTLKQIERVLKKAGIVIDDFLSKDVDYIVTDYTSHNSNQREKNDQFEGLQKSLMSRGQSLLMKSSAVNFSMYQTQIDPVQFAKKFNVPLITTQELIKVLQDKIMDDKQSDKNFSFLKMGNDFIKVEDCSHFFMPHIKSFSFPKKSKGSINLSHNLEPKQHLSKDNVGYCECCEEFCDNLSLHRRKQSHLSFIRNCKNYFCIDILIRKLPSLNDLMTLSENFSESFTRLENMKAKCMSSKIKLEDFKDLATIEADINQQISSIEGMSCSNMLGSNTNSVPKNNLFLIHESTVCSDNHQKTIEIENCVKNLQNHMNKVHFQDFRKSSSQSHSTTLYTCRPVSCQKAHHNQDLKLVITRVPSGKCLQTLSKNIKIQEISSGEAACQGIMPFQKSPGAFSLNCGLSFSSICNELLLALPQKSNGANCDVFIKNQRKQLKAKRRISKNFLKNHEGMTLETPHYSKSLYSNLSTNHTDFLKLNNFNSWSLTYASDLKVVFTKLSLPHCHNCQIN